MSALPLPSREPLREAELRALGVHRGAVARAARDQVLDLAWPELAHALPDGGLPRGVIELAAPSAHGGGTTLALAACRAALAQAPAALCAWLEPDPGPRLYAPEAHAAGVELARLLIVRAPREALARACVKVLATGAFALVVVSHGPRPLACDEPRARGLDERAVRRFALAAEEHAARVLVLTDSYAAHGPWPVALRLELGRHAETLHVRVAREKRGRVGAAKSVPLHTRPRALAG